MNSELEPIQSYNQFNIQKTIRSIWNETDLKIKKCRAINEVVLNFKYKEKQNYFINKINSCSTLKQVDTILSNIVLYGEGLGAV